MRKKRKPRIIWFATTATITILVWAASDLWRNFNKPAIVNVPPEISAQFTPTLDQQAINKIKTKLYFSDEEIQALSAGIQKSLQPSPTASPSGETQGETGQ